MEYVTRFVRLSARYEEEAHGSTKLGYRSTPFSPGSATIKPQLGSGILFSDEATGMRELAANASRIEGWRKTNSYQYCLVVRCLRILLPLLADKCVGLVLTQDFERYQATKAIKGVDILHQLFRLRHAKGMPDAEVDLIMRVITENLQSYDQVIEAIFFPSLFFCFFFVVDDKITLTAPCVFDTSWRRTALS